MMPTADSWRRMVAILHQGYPPALLARAMGRMPALPVDGLVSRFGCWWGPVVPLGADRFELDAAGGWALLLPVVDRVEAVGAPEFREWRYDLGDLVDVLALPLWQAGAEAEPRGWGGKRWRRFLAAADVLCPWAIGLDEGPQGAAPEPRLYRDPWGWLEAGAPLARAAVVLRWSRPVLDALARCRPIAEDEAHAAELATRLREHALRDLPEVRFPRRIAA
jgi:hypothetical protein